MTNTYPEPYRSKKKDTVLDPSTCWNRECVSYCAWKIKEATGKWPKRTGDMDAKNWVYRLPENGYKTVVATPNGNKCVGVYTGGKHGHVVWSDGTLTISEYNYGGCSNYGERTVKGTGYKWYVIKKKQPTPSGFLPAKGYWGRYDKDNRVAELAKFMRAKFPAYTPASALGPVYGDNLWKSIKTFQQKAGMAKKDCDGNTGPKTYAMLKKYGFKG